MSKPVNEHTPVTQMPEDFTVSIEGKPLMDEAEVKYTPEPVDKIRVVLYKGDKVFDSFSVSTKPKSAIAKDLVALVGRIITIRNKRGK